MRKGVERSDLVGKDSDRLERAALAHDRSPICGNEGVAYADVARTAAVADLRRTQQLLVAPCATDPRVTTAAITLAPVLSTVVRAAAAGNACVLASAALEHDAEQRRDCAAAATVGELVDAKRDVDRARAIAGLDGHKAGHEDGRLLLWCGDGRRPSERGPGVLMRGRGAW